MRVQIVQHGDFFAEWAFGAHTVYQEVKMKGCHGDQNQENINKGA